MNRKGEIFWKEVFGYLLFFLALGAVFAPASYAMWKSFSGSTEDNYAESTLDEIFKVADYMAGSEVFMNHQILLDKPEGWFLIGAEDKLCICKNIARNSEEQEIECEKEGGICEFFDYDFEIANYETDAFQDGVYPGRQKAIKFMGYNQLVIQRNPDNFFTFRKSLAEANLNSILNEFLNSELSEKDNTVEKIIIEACEDKKVDEDLFEKQIDNFFKPRVPEGDVIRFQIQEMVEGIIPINAGDSEGQTNKGLINPFYSYKYPEDEDFYDTINNNVPGKFQRTLPATYKILKDDCVVYLTSTTSELK